MRLVAPPALAGTVRATSTGSLTVATYNVHDLYDTVDDPATNDPVLTPELYAAHLAKTAAAILRLGAPDIVGLEEVENAQVLADLLALPALRDAGYGAAAIPGNDKWSHNDGFLYRTSKVTLDGITHENPTAHFADGQVAIDERLMFTTPPAVASFTVAGSGATAGAAQLTVILNHMKSKVGGSIYDQRRLAEGAFVGGLVDRAQQANPAAQVIVMGDLNADTAEPQVQNILHRADGSTRMLETAERLPVADRFSYIYRGTQKSLLDHVLVTPSLDAAITAVAIPHFDTQPDPAKVDDPTSADGSSDHDPVLLTLALAALGSH